ncbi:hypothetical protein BGZ59_007593 [Podila verticillata]|nr:hypothetical protein BGZ59_007593 [Podila verticillata]
MKFSIVAAISAIVLAVTSDAASVKLWNLQDSKGDCSILPVAKYDTCYTVSEFYLPRSAGFLHGDFGTDKLSSPSSRLGQLANVSGIAGSVMVQKGWSGYH